MAEPAGLPAGLPAGSPVTAPAGRIAAFLAGHTTVTLATAGEDGQPAAAAVFYAADAGFNLYFLSEPGTRHAQNLAARGQVAATIQDDGQDWQTITGLQMAGRAGPVPPGEIGHAAAVYAGRFPFVAGLPAEGEAAAGGSPATLRGPLARAKWYVLRPDWLRLTDNSLGFGHKDELRLAQEQADA